ncbi:MAG: MerR family DNA-binding transcriptional regulator, partial [Acutalibacteraceae bacterium]
MINYFSISEAAKIVGLTTETLRHYDRIDLVKPCKKDQWSGYRYYSEQEIVRLNT